MQTLNFSVSRCLVIRWGSGSLEIVDAWWTISFGLCLARNSQYSAFSEPLDISADSALDGTLNQDLPHFCCWCVFTVCHKINPKFIHVANSVCSECTRKLSTRSSLILQVSSGDGADLSCFVFLLLMWTHMPGCSGQALMMLAGAWLITWAAEQV